MDSCDASITPLILGEDRGNAIRYTYRVFWNVGIIFVSALRLVNVFEIGV